MLSRWMYRLSLIVALLVLLPLVLEGQFQTKVAFANNGDLVQTTHFSMECPSGLGVGIAFDGEFLWYSCYASNPDLYKAEALTGNVIATYNVVGGLGALAWDGSRKKLWAGAGCATGQTGAEVYLIDPATGQGSLQFNIPDFSGNCLDDGLAYDGETDTLYHSWDGAVNIRHISISGVPQTDDGFTWGGSGCYNSGLAIGGQLLYQGSNGCNHVWVVNKVSKAAAFDFPTGAEGVRDEDLECDNVTFRPRTVMWSIEAHTPRRAIAFEIPSGSCATGGGVDSDGDGLLDEWETDGITIDPDGNGPITPQFIDLHKMGADPQKPDIFLQIDWMEDGSHSHKLFPQAIRRVVESFAASPYTSPTGSSGINLHVDQGADSIMNYTTSETWGALSRARALTHVDILGTISGNDYNWSDFETHKNAANGFTQSGRTPVFHYVISAHSFNAEGNSGVSRETPASDFLVSLGTFADGKGTILEQAGTLMHELGHNLGLCHGGPKDVALSQGQCDVNYKPNYLSVMNYSFQLDGLIRNNSNIIFDYSRMALPSLRENALDETTGLSTAAAGYGTRHFCSFLFGLSNVWAPTLTADVAVDWNCDDDALDTNVTYDINGEGGSSQELVGYEDWSHLKLKGGAIGLAGAPPNLPTVTEVNETLTVETAEHILPAPTQIPVADAGGPYSGTVGETIAFIGSGSFDPDGTITLYEWDFESDGTFDVSSPTPTATHAYPTAFSGMVTLRVTDNDGNIGTGTAQVQIGDIITSDLSLSKTATSDPVSAGQNLTYDLTVTNNGSNKATGVTLVDNLPTGVSLISTTPSQGSCTEASGTVTCNLGELDSGEVATIEIVVATNSNTPTTITNNASVSSTTPDLNSGNNSASVTTTVIPAPSKVVIKEITLPSGGVGFGFGHNIDTSGDFTLNDTQSMTFDNVTPGSYTVTEKSLPTGWTLDNIACDDTSSATPSTVDLGIATANIKLDPGETVTCTFTNEEPAVILTQSYGISSVDEGKFEGEGSVACFWISLNSPPASNVTIAVAPTNNQVWLDKQSVTLTPSNWNTLDTKYINRENFVCVRAVDDHIVESAVAICADRQQDLIGQSGSVAGQECGDHVSALTFSVGSSDPHYNDATTPVPFKNNGPGFSAKNVLDVLIRDNDTAGVLITESFAVSDVDEDGNPNDTACYWLNLNSQPVQPVTINVLPDNTQVTTDKSSLVLDETNWNLRNISDNGNRVCILPINDNVDETAATICVNMSNSVFGQGDASNQVCGDHQGSVNHTITTSDPVYSQPSVPFTNTNGSDLDSKQETVDVLLHDDDQAGLTLMPSNLNLVEGQSATVNVKLDSQPLASVTVQSELATLTFTSDNWNQPQRMTVDVPENDLVQSTVTKAYGYSVSSTDPAYSAINMASLEVVMVDNDSAGVVVTKNELTVSEDGTSDTYELVLTSQPATDMSIRITDNNAIQSSPSTIVFAQHNWNQPQTVTISAIDNAMVAPNAPSHQVTQVAHVVTSSDPNYDNLKVGNVTVRVVDNDVAGIKMTTTGVSEVRESGGSVSYNFVLTSQPSETVRIIVGADTQVTATAKELVFNSNTWDQPQMVTIHAVDDQVAEGDDTAVVSFSVGSNDVNYHGRRLDAVTLKVADNDIAGITLSRQSLSLEEDGVPATYTIVLTSQPLTKVYVYIDGNMQVNPVSPCAQSESGAACLNFTPENWNLPQQVSVGALDNGEANATAYTSTIHHAIVSADGSYHNLNVSDITVTIVDKPDDDDPDGTGAYPIYLPYIQR